MTTNQYLIFGSGQIAKALQPQLGNHAQIITRATLDFSIASEVDFLKLIEEHQPAAIINAAAYTAVDAAENEGRDAAFQVNADAVEKLANAAFKARIPLVHYSTDYVFDGSGKKPWLETDATHPINAYGASKHAGEQRIVALSGDYLIFRISWVYDETGRNFLNTMLKLGAEREALRIVADQHGAPCYAGDIAEATLKALNAALDMDEFPSGIYHMANAGETSWHEFAMKIFEEARHYGQPFMVKDIVPITTLEYPTPAKRPLNSRMICEKLHATFNLELPDWQHGLADCLRNKYASGAIAD